MCIRLYALWGMQKLMNGRSDVLMERFILKYANNGLWYGTFTHFDKLAVKHGISS